MSRHRTRKQSDHRCPSCRGGAWQGLCRAGFSLVEATVAIAITSMTGVTVLVGLGATMQSTDYAMNQTIAEGIAEQLVDEVSGALYAAGDPYQWPLVPSGSEMASPGRQYNDIDDYVNEQDRPPVNRLGVELGQEDHLGGSRPENFRLTTGRFDNWEQVIEVYYVDDDNQGVRLAAGVTSNSRAVRVQVYEHDDDGKRLLAERTRVFSYIPGT